MTERSIRWKYRSKFAAIPDSKREALAEIFEINYQLEKDSVAKLDPAERQWCYGRKARLRRFIEDEEYRKTLRGEGEGQRRQARDDDPYVARRIRRHTLD